MATIIEMPKLSDTMSVGTVVKWHKQVGDKVSNGDVLAEIETDKATMELENFEDGFLIKIFVKEGVEVPIGSGLAAVGETGEDVEDIPPPVETPNQVETIIAEEESDKEEKSPPTPPPPLPKEEEAAIIDEESGEAVIGEASEETAGSTDRILASPLARKIAHDQQIELSDVQGSGPRGRVTKKDVLSHKQVEAAPVEALRSDQVVRPVETQSSGQLKDQVVPVSKMRSIIAQRLLESKNTIPHFYLQKEIDSQPLRLAREAINKRLTQRCSSDEKPLKLTLNDLILKACAESIKWVPEINTSWENDQIRYHGNVHLSFGVAVEDGLVTPVIRNAESLDLTTLSREAKSLIGKAKSKKLTPDEMTGSTFTVTNLGMFGIDFFSGIINPPNAAILSVGASVKKPVLDSCGNLQAGERMTLGLSCDHRLVDGAAGASFLKLLGEILERPASLLV
ncbi:MAG: 2-oxo acid dehydrogenase subunit E2 [Opitutae bacterium]|nr:2-oxo acid dehydrogenase subunit E2 [Opitutae bacterium]